MSDITSNSIQFQTFGPTSSIQDELNNPGSVADKQEYFCIGWSLKVSNNLPSKNLFSMFPGSISYKEEVKPDGKQIKQLILFIGSIFDWAVITNELHLPEWFPMPKYVIYENVDTQSVKDAIKQMLPNDTKALVTALEQIQKELNDPSYFPTIDNIAEIFVNQKEPQNNRPVSVTISVSAGQAIGSFDDLVATQKGGVITIKETLDDSLYLNPSYYFALFEIAGLIQIDPSHPLRSLLISREEAISSSGSVLFVKDTGQDVVVNEYRTYSDPNHPARTIKSAIDVALRGDYILILDKVVHEEGEIIIDRPVAISSISKLTSSSLYSSTTLPPDFPNLSGGSINRVIRVKNTLENQLSGVVHIGKLIIQNGKNGDLGGGGILVTYSNCTHIANCYIINNQTTGSNIFADGSGGGILCHHSSAMIFGNIIKGNKSTRFGGGIGVYGYGWPLIWENRIDENSSVEPTTRSIISAEDGGGIGISIANMKMETHDDFRNNFPSWARSGVQDWLNTVPPPPCSHAIGFEDVAGYSAAGYFYLNLTDFFNMQDVQRAKLHYVFVISNEITNNNADDEGGGIHATVMSKVFLSNNTIEYNSAKGFGGGLRATFGSEFVCKGEGGRPFLIRSNKCNWDKKGNSVADISLKPNTPGGGGISLRTSSAKLDNVTISNNESPNWAGGGIFFAAADEGKGFNEIRSRIFGISRVALEIDSGIIQANNAGMLDPTDDPTEKHGKGAGVYIFNDGIACGMRISINPREIVNPSNVGNYPNANRFYLQDRLDRPDPTTYVIYTDSDYSDGTTSTENGRFYYDNGELY